jgi:amino acid transporter
MCCSHAEAGSVPEQVSVKVSESDKSGALDRPSSTPIASAFRAVGANGAAALVSIAAVAGLTSVILVDLVGMGRIGFAISRDGLLPKAIGRVHPRWGTLFASLSCRSP